MPGLADMHVHLTGGWDGVSVDLLGYRRYLNALLYAGITTVQDTRNGHIITISVLSDEAFMGMPRAGCSARLQPVPVI